ncbi:hypothetical protein V6N12_036123 [Hibiscus sabdariffa]|uniref:Uncharacterized protein n=1 Tax=Hibiscus sabdariffa TaxID=183260 RepID=A0ABR2ERK0_9ROSI
MGGACVVFHLHSFLWRPEKNPLDLNNLPDDYARDGKVVFEEGSSSYGSRKKKNGDKDGKDECGKVYECSVVMSILLVFVFAEFLGWFSVLDDLLLICFDLRLLLGGSERETETLNRARQLVFNNDSLGSQGHLGCHPSYDPTLPFRSVYPPRMFPGSSSTLMPPPPPQPYLHPSPSRLSSYPINDYYVGHIQNSQQNLNYLGPQDSNYTCIGTPVGHGFGRADFGSLSNKNQEEGVNWGRSYAGGTQQRLENPSAINRFQDGF